MTKSNFVKKMLISESIERGDKLNCGNYVLDVHTPYSTLKFLIIHQ